MTTEDHKIDNSDPEMTDQFAENLARVEALSQRLMTSYSHKTPMNPALEGPGKDIYSKAMSGYMAEMMSNPTKIFEHQAGYWSRSVAHFMDAQKAAAEGHAPSDDQVKDRRFASDAWTENPWFNFVKQQYQMNSDMLRQMIADTDGLGEGDQKRLEFFTNQIIDMLAPTNFLGTNPEALQRAVETQGQSLLDGLENLVRDMEDRDGDLLVSLADREAFEVGKNIATAKGEVVYRNRMLELIQFAPTTETVHKIPLLIFPPWINKYYILDLKPKNSLIQWAVDQGYTVFVVSWVNPTEDFADVGLDTYIEEGYYEAMNAVKEITGEKQLNAVGYCVAGTVLTLTLALMQKRGDKTVKSATFFTTMTDFSDQGEFSVFLGDDFVDGIEAQICSDGILKSYFMSRTFSYLRANDLVYTPAIKSYMMGEAPPAFDLLYWNGDSTNLPGRMTVEYLRGLCQRNELAEGVFEICGETVSLKDVKLPLCAVACETDHIAAWKSCFNGFREFGSKDKSFILSESGHIAGIVNPPSKKKYGHYLNGAPRGKAEDWLAGAKYNEGSWWPHWAEWLDEKSGKALSKQVPARNPGSESYPSLTPAPGTYVKVHA
ncbi:PHA/PHB synthase family protein [Halocynthiibacter sp.]|uniref:PHA/PHB synthase family protein n=1 Tax=Halocynthiibacter sp. TaxID=1979210 RepID=UPI003C50DD1F